MSARRLARAGRWQATSTLSNALRSENSTVPWNVRTRPLAATRCGFIPVTSRPSNSIRPDDGFMTPLRRLKNVLLPAPLGPMTPMTSPGFHDQVDVREGLEPAEPLAQLMDLEDRHHPLPSARPSTAGGPPSTPASRRPNLALIVSTSPTIPCGMTMTTRSSTPA